MNKCPVCGGRTIKTEGGSRCLNAACSGAKEEKREGIACDCGGVMEYTHSSPYGDRTYACDSCSETKTY